MVISGGVEVAGDQSLAKNLACIWGRNCIGCGIPWSLIIQGLDVNFLFAKCTPCHSLSCATSSSILLCSHSLVFSSLFPDLFLETVEFCGFVVFMGNS